MSRVKKPEGEKQALLKTPRRADSRAIVDAILEAAAEAARDGLEGVSTNQIAKRAGVGVASLYRYFPNKHAIAAELRRAMVSQRRLDLEALLSRTDLTLQTAIEGACEIMLARDAESRLIRRTLALEIPYDWTRSTAEENDELALGAITGWLRVNLARVPDDLDTRVFVAYYAIHGVILKWVVTGSTIAADELVRQLVSLFLSYLEPP